MPRRVCLGSYTICAKEKYVSEEERSYEQLGEIGDRYNFFDFLQDFVASLSPSYTVDEAHQNVLSVSQYHNDRPKVYGEATAGSWGVTAELRDYETGNLEHTRQETEAEVMPHYFIVNAPDETTRAIMLLQRLGRSGIKGHFCRAMDRAFSDWTDDNYLLEFRRQVPGSVLERIREGDIKKVELITYDMPNELSDVERAVRGDHPEWDEVRGEVSVELSTQRAQHFRWQPWMTDVMVGERTFHEIQEDLGVPESKSIRLEVKYGGKTRTIDLANPADVNPFVDITDDVEMIGGQPRLEDVHEEAQDLLRTLVRDVRAEEYE